MDERHFLRVISGEHRGLGASLLRGALHATSWGYGVGIAVRNAAFDLGWRRVYRASVPVLSVGNLTAGGTGKTPFVAWLLGELQHLGITPALVSRGYGSLDGQQNDEARVIERLCPGVLHIQNRDRVAAVNSLGLLSSNPERFTRTPQPAALVLDDGFQHRRLHRDLDVVLIDATQPWGYGRLLPRGLLREPATALRRADLVILTRVDVATDEALDELRHAVSRIRGTFPDAELAFRPQRLVNAFGEVCPLSNEQQSAAAFCGIGNPAAFAKTLQSIGSGATPIIFPDHHAYTADDWSQLACLPADRLLCTLKDLVKLPPQHAIASRVWAVDIGVEFTRGEGQVRERVAALVPHAMRSAA